MIFFKQKIHDMFLRMLTDKNGLRKELVDIKKKEINLGLYSIDWMFHTPKNELGISGLVRWFDYKVMEQQYKFSHEPSFCEPPEVAHARFIDFMHNSDKIKKTDGKR